MVRMAAMAAVGLTVLVLSACAAQPRPAPLTPEEVAAFEQQVDDDMWANTGLDESERPTLPRGPYVSSEESNRAVNACAAEMDVAGQSAEFRFYVCYQATPMSPATLGYFSGEERLALYDYFQKMLIPCLELHGVHVQSAPPRWHTGEGPDRLAWHPVWSLEIAGEQYQGLDDDCPPMPAWAL
jgi:hypothetical protein